MIRAIFVVVSALILQACGGGGNEPVIPPTVNVPASKSTLGEQATTINFVNKSQIEVKVYWVDYTGAEKYYKTLAPGESYVQETFATHPWVARTSSTNAAVLFVIAATTPITAEIPAK